MLKRWTSLGLAAAMAVSVVGVTGCYGSFNLTRKLYTWNGKLGDKWINSLATFAMLVIPVYGVAGIVDYVVLNTVEFWTGSNPVTMAPGETEQKIVTVQGHNYLATATQNHFQLKPVDGGKALDLTYVPAEKSWYAISGTERILIAEWVDQDALALITPNGERGLLTR
jgi:hypothetical protein